MSWISGVRARLHLLFARRAAESRMDGEIDFHIEMETNRLIQDEGLSPAEARRRALAAFGGVTQHREALREGRGLAWLGGLSLDMKLGVRMLRKYPGLTVVGGLAMAFAIWAGTVTFELVTLFAHPTLPLPGGDRIVRIEHWNAAVNDKQLPSLNDFTSWETLASVTDLGAYRDVTLNLITSDGDARVAVGAEITASAFRIAPTPPLFGRTIVATDETPGAPPVVVLGYEVWRTRFAGASDVIGRTVQLGGRHAMVVGVMPDDFSFPVAHELWTPLRPDDLTQGPRDRPDITVFGRLAPGVTLEGAQTELMTIGQRMATEFPAIYEHLRPQVTAYANIMGPQSEMEIAIFISICFFAVMLLVLVCSNVALLLFARAATREGELVVRSALGASRRRIVMQLFAEALVLGCIAAAVGLAAAGLALRTWGVEFLQVNIGRIPFWYDPRLSPATVAYALGLTVLAAVIAGVLPALKITRGLSSRLKEGNAGGGGVRFGGVWTAIIIMQVAVTVAFPVIVFIEQREMRRIQSFDVGFPAEEYLGVMLEMDAPNDFGGDTEAAAAAQRMRYGSALEELRRRLVAEAGVTGVTFVDRLPRMFHREGYVEIDGLEAGPAQGGPATETPAEVSMAFMDLSYFEVLGAPILAGRRFDTRDLDSDARVVIVDQSFVDQVLRGLNPIGRRMRFVERQQREEEAPPEPWLEIVGVVKDLGMTFAAHQHRAAGVYLPADLASTGPLNMVVHSGGDPMGLAPRIREIAAVVDPNLRLSELQRLDRVTDSLQWFILLWLRITGLLTAIALLLSLAGIYAVLSFTVARRTREIGVRVALGASRQRLVAAIFRRPLTHVALGVLAGGALIVLLALALAGGDGGAIRVEGGFSPALVGRLVAYVVFMFAVCLLACIVPTWRALRVEPTEALRSE